MDLGGLDQNIETERGKRGIGAYGWKIRTSTLDSKHFDKQYEVGTLQN